MKVRTINNIFGAKERNGETGGSLIETLIALAIIGVVAAAFLSGLTTASKATAISDERSTAESLARSQLEYVKTQDYINYANPAHGDYELITHPAGYSVEITVVPIDADTGQPLPTGEDEGLQKIMVTIKHDSKSVLTIEDYKAER
jgi:type II secretory pathway pseudopilin PulG